MKKYRKAIIVTPLILLGLWIGINQLTSTETNRSIVFKNKYASNIDLRILYSPNYLPEHDFRIPIFDARPDILIPKGTTEYTYTPPDDVTRENRSRPILIEILDTNKDWVKVNMKADQNNPINLTLPDGRNINCWIEFSISKSSDIRILANKYISAVHME